MSSKETRPEQPRYAVAQTGRRQGARVDCMDDVLTNDQFRILRNARDGGLAPSQRLRPSHYLLDVELLLRGEYVTARTDGLVLTPLGAACLGGWSTRRVAPPGNG